MTIVEALVVRGEAGLLEAHVAFQLNAGVDLVLAAGDGSGEVLERFERAGVLRRVAFDGEVDAAAKRSRLARLAATEHGADWVLHSDVNEFWLPRGRSLTDVLVAIPPRYAVVQALVREFVPAAGDAPFAEQSTVRRAPPAVPPDDPATLLRQIHRADPEIVVDARGHVTDARQKLRAWYPVEVLTFPRASVTNGGEDEITRGLDDGSLVRDERLRDLLRQLDRGGDDTGLRFALPTDGGPGIAFPVPDIVDDAAYAGECAAVGEVDIERLDEQILELRARLDRLEQRLWPRVRSRMLRVVRR